MIDLHPSGLCFLDRDRPFVPVGVNYWPASCGVDMWELWPAEEIRADLRLMRDLKLNTIRFFLRWQDFEPQEGAYDTRAFVRLDELLGWCREYGIVPHPSLFVGWMSGGVFWPSWKRGRNLFSDEALIVRAEEFAAAATKVIAKQRERVLAIDIGNEMNCLSDAANASPAENSAWFRRITAAIRAVDPVMLLVPRSEQGQLLQDIHRFDAQHCDLLSMHGYPVPDWHATEFDGMADPLCADLLPAYCAAARSFAPVMLQEFGTILTADAERMRTYLAPMLAGARRAGANGFLYWCLRDIPAQRFPYTKNGMETLLGLVDASGRIKPGFEPFLALTSLDPLDAGPAPTHAVVWPTHWYHRDAPENPGNQPFINSRRLTLAFHFLKLAREQPAVVRLDREISGRITTIVVPGFALDESDQAQLLRWVRNGGRLIWHGPTAGQWGDTMSELLGARAIDYRAKRPSTVTAFGEEWNFPRPADQRCEVRLTTARAIARDDDGLVVVGTNRLGAGTVTWSLAQAEDGVAHEGPRPAARRRWLRWYAGMLST